MHDVAQLIDLAVEARADSAAVLHVGGRVIHKGGLDVLQDILEQVDLVSQLRQQRRTAGRSLGLDLGQHGAGIPQRLDLARSGGAVENAGRQPLNVKDMAEGFFQIGAGDAGRIERLHRTEPRVDGVGVHKGLLDPGAQQALAHRGFGLVEHPEQRAALLAPAHRLGQFQICAGHRRQAHILCVGVVLHGLDALNAVLLGLVQVVEKRRHSIRDKRVLLIAEGRAPVGAELVGHGLLHDGVLKAGILAQLDQGVRVLLDVGRDIFKVKHRRADQNLAGHIAAQLGDDGSADFFSVQLCGVGLAGGNVRKADARTPAAAGALAVNARQIVVFILGQHAAFNDRAGRDNTDDVALDKTLGEGRVLHLLTDGDLVALGDQARHVSLVGVERHAAHRGAFFLAAVFAGQRQLQLPRSRQRVVVEHFIEVTDAVEQNLVGMLFFDFKILLHHGRYCLLGHVSHSC